MKAAAQGGTKYPSPAAHLWCCFLSLPPIGPFKISDITLWSRGEKRKFCFLPTSKGFRRLLLCYCVD
jgi:hypothetical protein